MPLRTNLYLKRLILKDIRCFEHLELEFDGHGQSIVIIGDNGDGKSTILRSLAMGICDQSSASALFRELHGEYVRAQPGFHIGKIEVELAGAGRERFLIETSIKSLKAFERVEQRLFRIHGKRRVTLTQDTFPWDRIFATGYGAGIRVQGTSDYDYFLAVDALYPLFRYDVLLQNPELVVRRIVDVARTRRGARRAVVVLGQIRELLARVLQLEGPEQVYLEADGIYVDGPAGKIALSALADGYRGTVTWVLDLIAWWFVYRREWKGTSFQNVRGIVLIDEIEQHLHPRWQRNIMRLLMESFPQVQFVATTHSPLVASGCEDTPVHRLVKGTHRIERPFGWLAEDVYELMGLEGGTRSALFRSEVLERVRDLDLKRLRKTASKADLATLRRLDRQLKTLPSSDPIRSIIGMETIRRFLSSNAPKSQRESDEKR